MSLESYFDSPSLIYGKLANAESEFLYRGLRVEEVQAKQLIPKGIRTFEEAHVAMADAQGTYILKAIKPAPALHDHLLGLQTCGVSTSTREEVAKRYAGDGYVARINRREAKLAGIREIRVKEEIYLAGIRRPEDDEVILIQDGDGPFPAEIIEEIYKVGIRTGYERDT